MVQPEFSGIVIVCPHCGTRYQVSAEAIGSGRLVQCAACLKSWTATVPGSASYTPPPPEDDVLFDADAEAELDAAFEAEERRAGQIAAVPPVPAAAPVESAATEAEGTDAGAPRAPAKDRRGTRSVTRAALPIDRLRRTVRLAGVLLLAAIVGGGVLFRTEIVRQAPDLAGLYEMIGLGVNVTGLEFRSVRTQRALRDGVEVLTVDARVVGVSPQRVSVPTVLVTLLDTAGQPVYEWSVAPAARDLQAGEAVDIATSLTSPPPAAHAVRLTFTNGRSRTENAIGLPEQTPETPR